MVLVFAISLMFLVLSLKWFFDIFEDESFRAIVEDSWTRSLFVIVSVIFVLSSIGTYYGFVTPSYQISKKRPVNHYLMEVTEYSISGDSVVKRNIKRNVLHHSIVIKSEQHTRMCGKMIQTYYENEVRLNDGRVVKDDSRNIRLKVGDGIGVTEKFYPTHKIEINY